MSDVKTEAERVANQAKDTFNNTNVVTRNRVIIAIVVAVVIGVAYLFFKG